MRLSFSPYIALCLTLAPLACGDDDPGTGADGSGTAGDSSTGSADESTGDTSADESTGAATQGATGGSESSSGGPTEVFLGGEAVDFTPDADNAAIVGSEVHVFGMEEISAVTDDMGTFNLGPLPPDTEVALVLEPAEGDEAMGIPAYLGAIVPERTGTEDRDDVSISQIRESVVQDQIDLLMQAGAEEPDLTAPIVLARLRNGSALMTGNVEVSMDPPAAENTYYAPSAPNGALTLNSQTIEFSLLPVVVFYNLAPADPGAVTITATHPERECTVDHPEFPLLGGYITLVEISCL